MYWEGEVREFCSGGGWWKSSVLVGMGEEREVKGLREQLCTGDGGGALWSCFFYH